MPTEKATNMAGKVDRRTQAKSLKRPPTFFETYCGMDHKEEPMKQVSSRRQKYRNETCTPSGIQKHHCHDEDCSDKGDHEEHAPGTKSGRSGGGAVAAGGAGDRKDKEGKGKKGKEKKVINLDRAYRTHTKMVGEKVLIASQVIGADVPAPAHVLHRFKMGQPIIYSEPGLRPLNQRPEPGGVSVSSSGPPCPRDLAYNPLHPWVHTSYAVAPAYVDPGGHQVVSRVRPAPVVPPIAPDGSMCRETAVALFGAHNVPHIPVKGDLVWKSKPSIRHWKYDSAAWWYGGFSPVWDRHIVLESALPEPKKKKFVVPGFVDQSTHSKPTKPTFALVDQKTRCHLKDQGRNDPSHPSCHHHCNHHENCSSEDESCNGSDHSTHEDPDDHPSHLTHSAVPDTAPKPMDSSGFTTAPKKVHYPPSPPASSVADGTLYRASGPVRNPYTSPFDGYSP